MKKIVFLLLFPIAMFAFGEDQKENCTENTISVERINHKLWTALLQKHVSDDGRVDYKGFKEDETALTEYLELLSNNNPDRNWSRAEILAYWINVYNAFTVKLIVDHYPVKSIKDINEPWKQKFIKIGNDMLSLEDVEHEILRKMGEPRIHFAINCASYSCPKLLNTAYVAPKLESQLTMATKNFLADETKNLIMEKKVQLSKIFDWFASDFRENGGKLLEFIDKYSKVEVSPKARIRYKAYDWSLNE